MAKVLPFAVLSLLAAQSLAAQLSVQSVAHSPENPTFAEAITWKIEVEGPTTCALDTEAIVAEVSQGEIALTLPPCTEDGSPPLRRLLETLVEHQLAGTYNVVIYPGSPTPVEETTGIPEPDPTKGALPKPLWQGEIEIVEPAYDLRVDDPFVPNLSCTTLSDPGQPCAYQKALVDKLRSNFNPPNTFNWQSRLDWNFNSWRSGESQNLPVLAQALALVSGAPDLPRTKLWWNRFFDCQLGQTCAVPDPRNLVFFSGGEILSNIYNEHSLLAAMVVNFWTTRAATRDLPLANKARRFLRSAWYLYTLAAGNGPARSYFENGSATASVCQWSTPNQRHFYNGPFLALAGGRSKPTDGCLDDRAPLFAAAIQWEGFTRSGENREQKDLRQYLAAIFQPEAGTETVFAVDNPLITQLKAHVRGTTNLSRWLVSQLTASGTDIRLSREMRFLGWGGGIRASILSENPNTCGTCFNGTCGQTAAVFATKYDPRNQGEASFLFPWSGGIRRGLTRGYGKLIPTTSAPTAMEASNLTTGDTLFKCQPPQTVQFALPTSGLLYHVKIGPTGATCVSCP